MSATLILVVCFFCFFGLTIAIPTLPPAEIVCVFLEISEINSSIPGISGVVFVNAIVNGLFWGIKVS